MTTTSQAVPASTTSQQRCPEFFKLEFYKKIVTTVLKKLPWLVQRKKRKWNAPEILLVLTYSWLRGYSIHVASQRLNDKFFHQLNRSRRVFADGRTARLVPHQTTVNDWLAQFTLSQVDRIMHTVFETMLLRARAIRPSRFREILVDFDFTYQGYWGKRGDSYIIGSNMVKGTKFIRHYHGVLIHAKGISLFCALHHTPKNQSKIPFMIKTIQWLQRLGFKIRYAAMDREYYRYDIVARFKQLGVNVITPAKEYKQLLLAKEAYLNGTKGRIQEFVIGNMMRAGIRTKYCKCWVILFPKNPDRLDEIKRNFQHKLSTLQEASNRLFALITTRAPQWRGNSFPSSIRQYYRWRWGIETGFREVDEHPTIWRSDIDGERLLCEAGSYFIYNEWQLARFIDPRGLRYTFQMFRNEQLDKVTGDIML